MWGKGLVTQNAASAETFPVLRGAFWGVLAMPFALASRHVFVMYSYVIPIASSLPDSIRCSGRSRFMRHAGYRCGRVQVKACEWLSDCWVVQAPRWCGELCDAHPPHCGCLTRRFEASIWSLYCVPNVLAFRRCIHFPRLLHLGATRHDRVSPPSGPISLRLGGGVG